jgi:hypothetical protein
LGQVGQVCSKLGLSLLIEFLMQQQVQSHLTVPYNNASGLVPNTIFLGEFITFCLFFE